ncbi:uncharacterized protein LOC131242506 [Magnolia sinica]|uniref:uncharacterized protein LOC131242506 n=1 Tax=Magnolia sinica TaxID=86752 RepID=UPI0026584472|nr:uncharacterized protein LOC131242506 [Magnolia sinica]
MNRGVGGPLLSIGDLLSDVGEGGGDHTPSSSSPSSPSFHLPSDDPLPPSHLNRLFQENYNKLTEALKGTDQSWTALTLKLCASLETADKLIQSANSNVETLAEKIGELESIMKRGDSAVATAKAILNTRSKKEGPAV